MLAQMHRNIRPGTLAGAGPTIQGMHDRRDVPKDRTPGDAVERLAADIESFRRRHKLARVVVVHAASSEPRPPASLRKQTRFASLQRALTSRSRDRLPASMLYALAAVKAGCAYINFTPSIGIAVPALMRHAEQAGIAFMGSDGKTGETLVKSALAPMFAMRNLPILSWMGQNMLGNRDGAVLNDPATRRAKVRSKEKTVAALAGGTPLVGVAIDYVPSLSDWKVAWDFVHFGGFLGTKMSLQFTWHGADSVLAAPLVIDLVRLSDLQMRRGLAGAMSHLAFFFKDPIGCDDFNLFSQWQALLNHAQETDSSR
jgi:myo-inositol-1-phosphate synthase